MSPTKNILYKSGAYTFCIARISTKKVPRPKSRICNSRGRAKPIFEVGEVLHVFPTGYATIILTCLKNAISAENLPANSVRSGRQNAVALSREIGALRG